MVRKLIVGKDRSRNNVRSHSIPSVGCGVAPLSIDRLTVSPPVRVKGGGLVGAALVTLRAGLSWPAAVVEISRGIVEHHSRQSPDPLVPLQLGCLTDGGGGIRKSAAQRVR